MNNPRSFLLLALLLMGYLLWAQWQQDYGQQAPASVAATANEPSIPTSGTDASIPAVGEIPKASAVAPATPSAADSSVPGNNVLTAPATQLVTVTTNVLRVQIDPRGGSVVVADLLAYPQQPKNPLPVRLLDNGSADFFVAQSGLVSATGAAPDHSAVFIAERNDYRLADGADTVEVPLTWQDASGISVRKTLMFTRSSYLVEQRQQIVNATQSVWSGNAYRQLQREPLIIDGSGFKGYTNTERYSFIGAAWYTPQDKFQKLGFDKFAKEPLHLSSQGGWAGMIQHYFFAAWIPPPEEIDQYSTAVVSSGTSIHYLVRSVGPALSIPAGGTITSSAGLYVGPKLQSTLDTIAPGLSLTANYGIFTFIAQPLHWVLAKLHALTGNWGFAIILLVLLIKAIFFKLSEAQYRSMARMRKMQPRMAALKERFGDDRTKLNQAMLELYKKEKINPLGGCLPMLVQIPVFFALYWVLLESVELRQAPFILWIQNLSAPDPYFVLPILNGAAMIATQFLTPTTGMDPTQAKMMKAMPIVFAFLFAFFPAGLVLYWTTNGILSLAQQWIITRRVEAGEKTKA